MIRFNLIHLLVNVIFRTQSSVLNVLRLHWLSHQFFCIVCVRGRRMRTLRLPYGWKIILSQFCMGNSIFFVLICYIIFKGCINVTLIMPWLMIKWGEMFTKITIEKKNIFLCDFCVKFIFTVLLSYAVNKRYIIGLISDAFHWNFI